MWALASAHSDLCAGRHQPEPDPGFRRHGQFWPCGVCRRGGLHGGHPDAARHHFAPGWPGRWPWWWRALFALLIGAISLRTQGVYFIMITLAFAQMLYYLMVSLKAYGGDDGLSLARPLRRWAAAWT